MKRTVRLFWAYFLSALLCIGIVAGLAEILTAGYELDGGQLDEQLPALLLEQLSAGELYSMWEMEPGGTITLNAVQQYGLAAGSLGTLRQGGIEYSILVALKRIPLTERYAIAECHIGDGALSADEPALQFRYLLTVYRVRVSADRTAVSLASAIDSRGGVRILFLAAILALAAWAAAAKRTGVGKPTRLAVELIFLGAVLLVVAYVFAGPPRA